MWYDKYPRVPRPGSPLESVFILVFLRRKRAELLSTRAIVVSGLSPDKKDDPAVEAYEEYCDAMFPYIDRAQDKELDDAHKALMEITKHPLKIKMGYIYKQQADAARRNIERSKRQSSLTKAMKIRPKTPGV